MKKIEQIKINDRVLAAIKEFNASDMTILSENRLRTCNANVIETHEYYILLSYRTIVAFIDKSTGVLYDVLRPVYGYTRTSAQHISKFDHDYEPNAKLTYYPV